jgi:hypothetical protein
MILKLLWAPFSLARVACRVSTPTSALVGLLAICFQVGVLINGMGASIGEPYRDLNHYYFMAALHAPIFVFAGSLFWLLIAIPYKIVAFSVGTILGREGKRGYFRRALLIAPVCMIPPVTLGCMLLMLLPVQHPSFELISGKPSWVTSPWIPRACLGGGVVLVWYFVTVVVVAVRRLPGVMATMAEDHCGACGYDLTGNESGICPECGRAIL